MKLLGGVLQSIARTKLSVFVFHKIPDAGDPLVPNELDLKKFRALLDFIQEHFPVLPLYDAICRISRGKMDRGCACLTFDDGYPDWMDGVIPLLQARSVPATFFISAGQFFGRPMWNERLAAALRKAEGNILDTSAYRLFPLPVGTPAARVKALRVLEHHFKYLPVVIRDRYLEALENQCGVGPGEVPVMTVSQLRTISALGFDIGSHTMDHPILGLCDGGVAREEIAGTKEILEDMIRVPVRAFAYPNGRPDVDFNHQHVRMVRQAGYEYAVTTQWGVATVDTPSFQTPRFTPWGPGLPHLQMQMIRNLLMRPTYVDEKRH
jgi:peptidoglycan/xylan/chitin deacetylase (PgdA/CDA1 family)